MILKYSSYRTVLRAILAERVERNPSYSLRALARALGMPAPTLSSILSGKKKLSLPRAVAVAEKLEFTLTEKEYFTTLVQFENSRHPSIKETLERRLRELAGESVQVHDLSLDQFRSIAKWYHLALLQLFDVDSRIDAAVAARRLGISRFEAQDALERLERLDLVELLDDAVGGYRRVHARQMVSSDAPNLAIRAYNRAILDRAIESLESQPNTEKFTGSDVFAFAPEMLPEATEIIERCFSALLDLAAKGGSERSEVYCAAINLFRLTQKEKENVK